MATRMSRDCLNEQNSFACASLLLVHFYAILEKEFLNAQFFEGHEIIMMKDFHFSL